MFANAPIDQNLQRLLQSLCRDKWNTHLFSPFDAHSIDMHHLAAKPARCKEKYYTDNREQDRNTRDDVDAPWIVVAQPDIDRIQNNGGEIDRHVDLSHRFYRRCATLVEEIVDKSWYGSQQRAN